MTWSERVLEGMNKFHMGRAVLVIGSAMAFSPFFKTILLILYDRRFLMIRTDAYHTGFRGIMVEQACYLAFPGLGSLLFILGFADIMVAFVS